MFDRKSFNSNWCEQNSWEWMWFKDLWVIVLEKFFKTFNHKKGVTQPGNHFVAKRKEQDRTSDGFSFLV